MGFLDAVLGGRKKLKGVAPDRLFAMTTAYVTMETGLDMKSAGSAGIVFQPLATADFDQILKDAEELLHGTAEETDSKLESADDEFGYRWIILRDPDFEDLVVVAEHALHRAPGRRLRRPPAGRRLPVRGRKGKRVYFIYNFKRGAYYPFVPAPATSSATPSTSCG